MSSKNSKKSDLVSAINIPSHHLTTKIYHGPTSPATPPNFPSIKTAVSLSSSPPLQNSSCTVGSPKRDTHSAPHTVQPAHHTPNKNGVQQPLVHIDQLHAGRASACMQALDAIEYPLLPPTQSSALAAFTPSCQIHAACPTAHGFLPRRPPLSSKSHYGGRKP
jgi:hypothetical protein